MRTYYRWPSPKRGEFDRQFGGIVEALLNYSSRLSEHGWREIDTEDDADLVVGHLGTQSKRLDVFHVHGLYPTGETQSESHNYRGNVSVIENIRRARHTIAVSQWVADILRRDMHLDPWVLGHGFDCERWDEIPQGEFSTEPFALWNKTRVNSVCDPTPVVELARRFPKFRFATTFLPRRGQGAAANVVLTGLLEHKEAWKVVRDCTIYLGTTKETFGIGALEAMASGAVVVGYRWGATPEVVGGCGLFVEPGDYDALALAFQEALDRRHELGQKARERVCSLFSWSATIRKLAEFYNLAYREQMGQRPKVTVVIPVFNYARYVRTAIGCVRQQTLKDYELVIVDDGSTDDSAEVVTEAIAGMPNARLIQQENVGVAHARNRGIAVSTGEYICCLDADDGIAPPFLEILAAVLDDDHSLGIAYTGLGIINGDSKIVADGSWPKPYDPREWIGKNQIPTCCLFRRSWWERLGGFRQRFAPHGAGQEDADFWLRILAHGGGAKMVTEQHLFYYRVHKDQTTKTYPNFWAIRHYLDWHPYASDGQYPFASQIGAPEHETWPVLNYDQPDVSIIIPVGPGHEHCLVDALDSVEAQTHRKWEVIVVNDAGQELNLRPWPFVKLVETSGQRGAGYARNRGTEVAVAPLVVYLDADDIFQPTFLSECLSAWKENGNKQWIYTDHIILHDDGTEELYKVWDWNIEKLWRSGLAAVTCLLSKQMWQDVGGFDEKLAAREDWDFHMRLTKAGYCGLHLPTMGFTYRHATGRRRGEQDKLGAETIRERVQLKELQVATKGCKSCGDRKKTPKKSNNPGHNPIGYVPMEYTSRGLPDMSYKGRGGRIYRVGDGTRRFWAHPDDIPRLMRLGKFRRVNSPDEPKKKITVDAKPKPVSIIAPAPVRPKLEPAPVPKPTPEPKLELVPTQAKSLPDPGNLRIAEIRQLQHTSDEWAILLSRERKGKGRARAIAFMEERRAKG